MPKERKGYIAEKNGRIYARITYTDSQGKRRELTRRASDKREAKKLLKQLRDEINKPRPETAIEGSRITFSKLADIYQERKLTPPQYVGDRKVSGLRSWKTLLGYLVPLRDHFHNQKINAITHHDIEQYKLIRLSTPKKRGGKSRTITNVNRELELLRSMLIYAKNEGWIQSNPFDRGGLISKADEKKRDRVLSLEEEQRLLDACTDKRCHIKPLLVCAIDTGMRRGELLSLQWSDIDLKNRIIFIKALNTKTLTARTVPISDRLAVHLEGMRNKAGDDDDDVRLFTVVDIRKSFHKACETAGIVGLHFHSLRATFCTRLIEAGMPIEQVAKLSGHTQLSTLYRHYLSTTQETIQRAADILNSLNRGR
ncbi:MAG TPA: tyrosine-type recombinase/integrase [Blastocatellia bacterium]|nr:tyrosine-type recombinase/integrase [Blastocatellia bacterium]